MKKKKLLQPKSSLVLITQYSNIVIDLSGINREEVFLLKQHINEYCKYWKIKAKGSQ